MIAECTTNVQWSWELYGGKKYTTILASKKKLSKLTYIGFMSSDGLAFGEDTPNKLPCDTHPQISNPNVETPVKMSLVISTS